MEPVKTLSMKQIAAIRAGTYGKLTGMIHQLAETALRESAAVNDARDSARRLVERLQEYTNVRPEHERVLILLTRPLGETGLPALEVYKDRRAIVKVVFEDEKLPIMWNDLKDTMAPETKVIPSWLYNPEPATSSPTKR